MTKIRQLQEEDDFEAIRSLMSRTLNRMNPTLHYGGTIENIKMFYRNQSGFIAEENETIVGFAGVLLTKDHGGIQYGYEEGCESAVAELIDQCAQFVRERGGTRLLTNVSLKFGQVRSRIISVLESIGFVSEEYVNSSFNMDLTRWEVPEDFYNDRIEPATDLQIDEIREILKEDGEDYLARMFTTQFSINPNYTRPERDYVFLVLKDKDSDEIAGISYYRVHIYNKNDTETVLATACGLHFRPKSKVDRAEKRRFLQGTYLSMKQLGIRRAVSQMIFHQFDLYAAIAAEGFYSITSQNNHLVMTKTL